MFLATTNMATTLRIHIRDILGIGSQEKVSYLKARRIIARMANHHSIRDRPVLDLPHLAMGSTMKRLAIAIFVRSTLPDQASVGVSDGPLSRIGDATTGK